MSKPVKKRGKLYVQGTSFDSSRFQPDMDWTWADSRSVDASLSPDIRKRIRERARYEVANNSYASGAGTSIVNAVIPKQPKLQFSPLLTSKRNDKIAKQLELDFADWSREVKLAQKLRSMRFAKYQDGESFAILHENPKLNSDVKLDFSPIDCDRVTSNQLATDPKNIDGIVIDDWGNPVEYSVLDYHPGDIQIGVKIESTTYKADRVLHWFKKSTPEQHRGVSEISPSLLLFSFLRRYTYSVVRASEVAADMALILKTQDIEVDGSDECPMDSPMLEAPFSRGTVATLPEGFDATQLKAEQPTAQFSTLVDELLGAIGASLGLPRLVMRKSATGFTYSAAKVDLSDMERFVNIERDELNENIIIPLFNAFKREWELVNNIKLPKAYVTWYYDGGISGSIDPLKDANAQAVRLANGTTTLASEYAKLGLDWETELDQRAVEQARLKELGLMGITSIQDNEEIE